LSQVNTGRILVNVQGEDDPVVKFVAVFGGGLDSEDRFGVGNWIYMVDIETGKAIYKREVASGVASEPAAVDTDQDGLLDTLYVGTAGGLLFKVDMSTPADVDPSTGRISDLTQWAPFAIFDTVYQIFRDGAPVTVRDPIFYPPTVTFVASQGKYALAFGTGDREDLFGGVEGGSMGHFYVILDSGFQEGVGVLSSGPLTETSFQHIVAASPDLVTGDFLTAPLTGMQPGWVLQLADDERVVTKALLVSGLLVFTTFTPTYDAVLCEYCGLGNVYALLATNANSIAGPTEARALAVQGFAGRPVVTTTGATTAGATGGEVDPFEAARIQGIRENLMDLFPADCRFGTYSLNVGVTLSNTSFLPVASVPVCVARKNWTEHF
jgi:Tfp pilus tip-associated adhesin PilY1